MDEEPATSDVIIDKAMWHSGSGQDKEDLLKEWKGWGAPLAAEPWKQRLCLGWRPPTPSYPTLLIFKNLLKTWCNYSGQDAENEKPKWDHKIRPWKMERERERESIAILHVHHKRSSMSVWTSSPLATETTAVSQSWLDPSVGMEM